MFLLKGYAMKVKESVFFTFIVTLASSIADSCVFPFEEIELTVLCDTVSARVFENRKTLISVFCSWWTAVHVTLGMGKWPKVIAL